MTSSLQPLMQLHRFDDTDLSRLQHVLDCIYQLDFQSPFLFTGASGLYSYLMYSDIIVRSPRCYPRHNMYLDIIVQSPGCYPRHNMYVGFIIMLFIWLMFRPTCIILFSPFVYWTPYFLYFASMGIGIPPPPPIAQVLTHKRDFRTYKSRLLRV